MSLAADVLPLVLAAAALLALWLHWRAAKTPEARRVLTAIRAMMDDAIAEGGLSSGRFLAPEAQAHERELGDLIGVEGKGQLHDGSLRDDCRAVLESYRRVFASAPADEPWIYMEGTILSPSEQARQQERRERLERQVGDARLCREGVNRALARIDSIERFTWRRG